MCIYIYIVIHFIFCYKSNTNRLNFFLKQKNNLKSNNLHKSKYFSSGLTSVKITQIIITSKILLFLLFLTLHIRRSTLYSHAAVVLVHVILNVCTVSIG